MSTCGILFAKDPRPGQVKTRLHACCTPAAAAALYRAFVLDSIALLRACAAQVKVVAYAPAGAEEAVRELAGAVELVPQPEGDLGQRMDCLMRWGFARGAERALIIGSDSPSLPPAYLDQALELLRQREVVIGPSTDGGYYLIGLRHPAGELFAGIEWSTGKVLQQTLERLGGRSLGLLPPWYDVDTPQDAGWLKVHLEALHRAGSRQGAHSLEVLRSLELPFPS